MKYNFLLFVLCLNAINIFAEPVNPKSFDVVQNNGDTIEVYLKGDEYASWYEIKNGDIVDIDPNTQNFYYVRPISDSLALSNITIYDNNVSMFDRNLIMTIIDNNRTIAYNNLHPSHIDFDSTDQETMAYIQNLSFNDSVHQQRVKKGLEPNKSKKFLTILMEFQDIKFEHPLNIRNLVDSMINEEFYTLPNVNKNFPSVNSYYKSASYNKLDIKADVVGPYTANHNRKFYGAKTWFSNDVIAKRLVYEAICKAANEVDFSDYDNDGDGYVECIHILFAGQGQNEEKAPSEAIWPHQGSMKAIYRDNVCISGYIVTPEKYQNNYRGIGTICHELGHIFGAPDFYDTKHNKDTFPGTGTWDLMGGGNWNGYEVINDTDAYCFFPAHPNPYVKKEVFGWIKTIDELSGNDSLYTLRPAELDSNGIYKLSTSTSGEYYLLENRQDAELWNTGLVVYHVHKNIKNGFLLNNVNVGHPQKMYVVNANNHIEKSEMGTPKSYGNINSFTTPFKSTGSQNMYFTSTSLPSNSNWNGDTTYNKDVCFISEEMIDGEKCVKFVLNPEIEGDDILCDSAVYSLKHVPSEATIEWTFVRSSEMAPSDVPVRIGSGQGTMKVYYKRGVKLESGTFQDTIDNPDIPFLPVPLSKTAPTFVPYSGDVTLKVNITLNGNTYSLFKTIHIPEEPEDIEIERLNFGSLNVWCKGVTKTMTLNVSSEEDWMNDVRWYVDAPGCTPYFGMGSFITVTPTATGTATIIATLPDDCNSKSDTVTYQIVQLLGTSFANPVSGSVEINIIRGDELDGNSNVSTMALDDEMDQYIGVCRLELWHDVYGKVREMEVPENISVVMMDLGGLNSGVYVLRLIIDNQIVEASQLIVR